MIGLLGTLGALVLILTAVKLVRSIFGRNPPVETFVAELDTKLGAFGAAMQTKAEEINKRLHEFRDELKLDGTRRSKTLFEHIKEENTAIYSRLNEHDRQLARLEERTKGKHGHH